MKLHLGCGRSPRDGWVNLDMADLPGVDVVFDLDSIAAGARLPFDDDTFTDIVGIDLIEHLHHPLEVMQELHRVAADGARLLFELPYGSSDDAWEDPTHRRPYFIGSWGYFSQPYYWRADYGYRGDWRCDAVILDLWDTDAPERELLGQVMTFRNIVARQTVQLVAVKPARPADRSLMDQPQTLFRKFGG